MCIYTYTIYQRNIYIYLYYISDIYIYHSHHIYIYKDINIYIYISTCTIFAQVEHRYFQPGKITPAVREASVSRHNGGKLRTPLRYLHTIVLRWSEGFQGGPELGRHTVETPVSPTGRLIVVFFSVAGYLLI